MLLELNASPQYLAAIECVPTDNVDVTRVATPLRRIADPMTLVPSLSKLTNYYLVEPSKLGGVLLELAA